MKVGIVNLMEREFERGIPVTDRVCKAVASLYDVMEPLWPSGEFTARQAASALVSTYISTHVEDGECGYSLDGHICTGSITLGNEVRVSAPNLWKWVELFDALREAYQNKESGRSDSE